MPLEPGATIDRYVIVRLLGKGGMGEVYEAHDSRLQRKVALKVLRARAEVKGIDSGGSSPKSSPLLREARLAAALEHANVVSVYDVGEVGGAGEGDSTMYLAMELISGRTLRAYVGDPSVPMSVRVRWLTDVARALAAAHARGLVHRDIKPENIMIRDDGAVKVLDFGIAKRAGAMVETAPSGEVVLTTMTAKGMTVGTPYYMAPEQMRGEPLDGRADQFAWGVVAYELLSGSLPWSTGGDGVQLVAEVLSRDPPLLSAESDEIPTAAAATVMRALAKSPEHRFASMDPIVASLDGGRAGSEATPSNPRAAGAWLPLAATELAPVGADPNRPLREASGTSSQEVMPLSRTAQQGVAKGRPRAPAPLDAHAPSRARPAILATLVALGVAGFAGERAWTARKGATQGSSQQVAPAAGCVSNAACSSAHDGKPYVCHHDDGTCASIESVDCKLLAEPRNLARDDTVYFGMLMPRTGPLAPQFGDLEVNGADLARRDFAQTVGAAQQLDAPRLALVACDDEADAQRAAHHLVDDVRVPGVIGFENGVEAFEIGSSVLLPKGVLTLVGPNPTTLLMNLRPPPGEPRLVWRTSFNAADAASPVSAVVADVVERDLRGKGIVSDASPMRVALVQRRSADSSPFAKVLFADLVFNGKSALANEANYREIAYVKDSPDAGDAYASVVSALAAFAPHVVVYAGDERLIAGIVEPLEARWPAALPYRPRYVTPLLIPNAALAFIGKSAERRRRFLGLEPVSNTPENARFVMHYNETYADKVTRTVAPGEAYDAFYVLAYATYARNGAEVTGKSLATAIPRLLPPGRPTPVGPADILDAFGVLRSGGNIDLTGAGGKLDFDPATGDQQVDMVVLCPSVDDRGAAADNVESGLVFDSATRKLRGKSNCR